MSYQADAETSTSQHKTLATDTHGPDGIRIGNPSKPAAEEPRLRRRGHWDRKFVFCGMSNSVHTTLIRYKATLIPKQGVLPTAQFVMLLFHLGTKCEYTYTDAQSSSNSRHASNLSNAYPCSY
jgi:hypothetical protein